MPWKERRTMGLKLDFVEKVEKGSTIAGACREHGITRTTGHKWWKRASRRAAPWFASPESRQTPPSEGVHIQQ
jgi:transposase-like protein